MLASTMATSATSGSRSPRLAATPAPITTRSPGTGIGTPASLTRIRPAMARTGPTSGGIGQAPSGARTIRPRSPARTTPTARVRSPTPMPTTYHRASAMIPNTIRIAGSAELSLVDGGPRERRQRARRRHPARSNELVRAGPQDLQGVVVHDVLDDLGHRRLLERRRGGQPVRRARDRDGPIVRGPRAAEAASRERPDHRLARGRRRLVEQRDRDRRRPRRPGRAPAPIVVCRPAARSRRPAG